MSYLPNIYQIEFTMPEHPLQLNWPILLPIIGNNLNINWGDGSISTISYHKYRTYGTYRVTIIGNITNLLEIDKEYRGYDAIEISKFGNVIPFDYVYSLERDF